MKFWKFLFNGMPLIVGLAMACVQFIWSDITSTLSGLWGYLEAKCPIVVKLALASLSFLIVYCLKKVIEKRMMRNQFKFSMGLIKDKMLPIIRKRSVMPINPADNSVIDAYIQSPLEYANETVNGNQLPSFWPDDDYQDVVFNTGIKYIIAITAENPNLFLDPTIGFYMSNCYAASLIRHTNEQLFKFYKSKTKDVPQLCMKGIEPFNKEVLAKRKDLIKKLQGKKEPKSFEFIRFFLYDEHQGECCERVVFPSLKASQDLYGIHSFYVPKENLINFNEENWNLFQKYNTDLWTLYGEIFKNREDVMAVKDERIKNTIPEFLFVFYDHQVEIHTYLGGEYKPLTFDWDVEAQKVETEESVGTKIQELIRILADYIVEDNNCGQLVLTPKQENQKNTYIVLDLVPPKDLRKKRSRKTSGKATQG